MLAINPDYMTPLFTETAGKVLLVIAVGLEFMGIMLMRSMMNFEV
jgi:Flp pilus assembly protein TadB